MRCCLNFKTQSICADSGYYSGEIHRDMFDMDIKTYIPPKNGKSTDENAFSIEDFTYDEEKDCFLCPNNKILTKRSYRVNKGLFRYASDKKDCIGCEFKEKCTKNDTKIIERACNFKYTTKQNENVNTEFFKEAMRLRMIFCEGNFAHQKHNHNLNNLRKRGKLNVLEHCLLSACALNLKRLVKALSKKLCKNE